MARFVDNEFSDQQQNAAPQFDVNPNADFGEDDLPIAEGEQVQEEVAETKKYSYKPSEKTLEKLNALPKEDLAKEFGIHLDDWTTTNRSTGETVTHKGLISSAREYGVLEDLADGRFTRKPIYVKEKVGHKRDDAHYALVRVLPASADGKYDWSLEERRIEMKYRLDDNGQRMVDKYGKPLLSYERAAISKDTVIKLGTGPNAPELTQDQHDQVRLLGIIEGSIMNDRGQRQVWVANDYDPTVLVAVNTEYIDTALKNRMQGDKGKGVYFQGRERHEFEFDKRAANLWAEGKGAFVKNEKGENKFLRYDPVNGRFGVSVTFDVAIQKDRAREKEIKAAKQQRRENKPAQRPQGPRPGGH